MTALEPLVARTSDFIRDTVIPVEYEVVAHGRVVDDALRLDLQKKAKDAGVFGPLSDVRYGGLGLDTRAQARVLEAAGASLLGPLSVNGSAPDDGNIHLLAHAGTPEQKERYLAPLASGDIRSSIAMTEPAPGAGSDPSLLRTVAERTGSGWVINGEKHFTTGADGAGFTICVAATADGPTMFLVDQDNPGLRVGRRMPTLDHSVPGGHCEVDFVDCAVTGDAVLGEVGLGMEYAQVRLAPPRLVFCMNWLALAGHEEFSHYPNCADVPESAGAAITGRSYTIAAGVHVDSPDAEGVLYAHGGVAGGHSLYVKDHRLRYTFNWLGTSIEDVAADRDLTPEPTCAPPNSP